MSASAEMPRYRCHKEVHALKIAAIEINGETGAAKIAPADRRYAPFEVEAFKGKFKGRAGDLGYYVVYADGYQSWSPSDAFEDGYTLII